MENILLVALGIYFVVTTTAHTVLAVKGYRFYPKNYVDELIERVWTLQTEKIGQDLGKAALHLEISSLRLEVQALEQELRGLSVSYDDLNEEYHKLDEEVEDHRTNCLPQAPRKLTMGA